MVEKIFCPKCNREIKYLRPLGHSFAENGKVFVQNLYYCDECGKPIFTDEKLELKPFIPS
jgi:uncharacterized protein with PIN domain